MDVSSLQPVLAAPGPLATACAAVTHPVAAILRCTDASTPGPQRTGGEG